MAKKDLIYSDQFAIFGSKEIIGFGSDEFSIKELDRNKANKIIVENHYSKKFYNATYIHLGVYIKTELVGVLQFGYAMKQASSGSSFEDRDFINRHIQFLTPKPIAVELETKVLITDGTYNGRTENEYVPMEFVKTDSTNHVIVKQWYYE